MMTNRSLSHGRLARLLGVVSILLSIVSAGFAAGMNITKERVCIVPAAVGENCLGIQTYGAVGYFFFFDGAIIKIDLETGRNIEESTFAGQILDATLYAGKPLGLGRDGLLKGACDPSWPRGPYGACLLEAGAGELFLGGASPSLFLAKNATSPVIVQDASLSQPFHDGFLWTVKRHTDSGSWHVELVDMFGNRMKRLYRFSREFAPAGLTIGPAGPEHELLLSYFAGPTREVVLIGQNGRMFWKLTVPAPLCRRDLAWDHRGNLLVIEKEKDGVVLNRWKFALPEG